MYKLFTSLCLIISLAGCGGDSAGPSVGNVACGSGSSPYLGCWRTIGCQSLSNPGGSPVWGIVSYNFASNGNLYEQGEVYSNPTCTGTAVYDWSNFTDLSFTELGSETLASGPMGYRLNVEDVTTGGAGTTEVLVAVSNGQLCLSDSLLLASADSMSVFFSQTPTDVNYSNCLDFL